MLDNIFKNLRNWALPFIIPFEIYSFHMLNYCKVPSQSSNAYLDLVQTLKLTYGKNIVCCKILGVVIMWSPLYVYNDKVLHSEQLVASWEPYLIWSP